MTFKLHHTLVSHSFTTSFTKGKLRPGEHEVYFKVSEQGKFAVHHAGRLLKNPVAHYTVTTKSLPPVPPTTTPGETGDGGSGFPLGGQRPPRGQPAGIKPFVTSTIFIELQLRIFTPDGREFTAAEVTPADLEKYRDRRGSPVGLWSYTVNGESKRYSSSLLAGGLVVISSGLEGVVEIGVEETVHSQSAPPLVRDTPVGRSSQTFSFDLFRVGEFIAELRQARLGRWSGNMRLIDPDGVVVAQTTKQTLRFTVGLATLNKSRDSAGKVRNWRLEVSPEIGIFTFSNSSVNATVIGKGRITIAVLKKRIDAMLGPRGTFIQLFGENRGDKILARLIITDPVAAETIDMYGLLDKLLKPEIDLQAKTPYTLYSYSEADFGIDVPGLNLDAGSLKVGAIDITIGPGVRLGASVPTVRLAVEVLGELAVKIGPVTIGTGKVRDGKLEIEVGIRLDADGSPQTVCWVRDDPLDLDFDWNLVTVLAASSPLVLLGEALAIGKIETKETELNKKISDAARALFADPALAPSILMTLFGAHLSHKPFRIEGDQIVFDYIAPLEPEPKPRPDYDGAIGRKQLTSPLGLGQTKFIPLSLGDTWKADNLATKIDHIVVVMMENRSYDHVLGYRAQQPINDGADGLSAAMIKEINKAPNALPNEPFEVRGLREGGLFPFNDVGKRTRLPKSVGHETHDVKQQLSEQTAGPEGYGTINSPKGFVDNFKPKLKLEPDEPPHEVVPNDVLGFYDQLDLPFYAYLADNYAYSDRYYCSHPGPTLPNRMYSLTGDLQHDRYGFPILDNNEGDNFLLSRTPTIYDVLTRKGISWRVYESAPSITMLRMFARYATNTTDILPLGTLADPFVQLKADVTNNNLPAFTAIEPAMHHHPQNDDHPDADMYRGQIFLQEVYNTLRSNPDVWKKTMLIITYDEHGGLYDHVIPPIADVLAAPVETMAEQPPLPGSGRPGRVPRPTGSPTTTTSDDPTAPAPPPTPAAASLSVQYGVRVPTFVISPWSKPGKGPSITLDHCSILKTVLARFLGADKPFMSDRVNASQTFNSFLTEPQARMNVPDPQPLNTNLRGDSRRLAPGASAIITPPLSRKAMREGPVDYHALSGRLARMLGR